jgi:hypothetical protein
MPKLNFSNMSNERLSPEEEMDLMRIRTREASPVTSDLSREIGAVTNAAKEVYEAGVDDDGRFHPAC